MTIVFKDQQKLVSSQQRKSIHKELFHCKTSLSREYNLKYLGKIGNVFHTKDIEMAIDKGRKYNPDNFNPYAFTSRSMGIDPDDYIQILYFEEHHYYRSCID
ncbi:MAG TPA: hypothetical protein VJ729_02565 [Nitrososphaeraceae archaeon]|nr:hypothetical protein [Nitrososphaeraceae archaeon]